MSGDEISIRLEFEERPWTTNAERSGNRWTRAELVKRWRSAFYWLAKKERMRAMEWVVVTVEPWQKGGRLQDVAACNPAVKAAIDGLVDAKVIPDDSPEFLRSVNFLRPQRGRNSLVIYVRGVAKT
jgi:crossover junction endodeoxyribonuclease RusA